MAAMTRKPIASTDLETRKTEVEGGIGYLPGSQAKWPQRGPVTKISPSNPRFGVVFDVGFSRGQLAGQGTSRQYQTTQVVTWTLTQQR